MFVTVTLNQINNKCFGNLFLIGVTNGGSDAPDASDSDNDEDEKTNDEENRSESPPKPKRKRGRPPKVVRKEEKQGKDRWVSLQAER